MSYYTDPSFKILYISRVSFFDIVKQFPEIRENLVEAGETFIRGRLTEDEKNKILEAFPNSVWE
jgi:hypothetical protein